MEDKNLFGQEGFVIINHCLQNCLQVMPYDPFLDQFQTVISTGIFVQIRNSVLL